MRAIKFADIGRGRPELHVEAGTTTPAAKVVAAAPATKNVHSQPTPQRRP